MKKHKLYLIAILTLVSISVKSQEYFELASFQYLYSPNNKSDFLDNKTDYSNFKGSLNLPIVINDNNTLILGFFGQAAKLKNSSPVLTNYNMYNTTLNLTWFKKVSGKNSFFLTFAPQIASDFIDITNKDFRFNSCFGYINTRNENFKMLYFLQYQHEFNGPTFFPLVGFDWKINEKFKLNTLLPAILDFKYLPTQKIGLGFYADADITTYRLSETNNNNSYMEASRAGISIYTEYAVIESIVLRLSGGYSINRYFREYEQNVKYKFIISGTKFGNAYIFPPLSNDFDNGLFVEVKLIYRIKK